jgi:hypothetical protein
VATINIPNAFIQAVGEDSKDRVIIRIQRLIVNILEKIEPHVYGPYVTFDKRGNKQLLVECLNAIYGNMVASLLYYRKFTTSLSKEGYRMNPYDPCIWNKMIDGKQMTICFHVDNCNLSHISLKAIDKMIEWLRRDYESIFEDGSRKMMVHQGKVNTYLGMSIDFSEKCLVSILMKGYLSEAIAAWHKAEPLGEGFQLMKNRKTNKTSTAPDDLFKVDKDATKLGKNTKKIFHNIAAKMLYATKQARPDTLVAIAFLTTHVREPDVDDWRKLKHLIEYLRLTKDLPLRIGVNKHGTLEWYVDALFAVHPNMRGHAGGGLTMGTGFLIVGSWKLS